MSIKNLPQHLYGLQKIIEDIVNDIRCYQEETRECEEKEEEDYYLSATDFYRAYTDLVTANQLRRILRENSACFNQHAFKNEHGVLVFDPYYMLQYLERNAANWKTKTRCQQYLTEYEECD